MARHVMVWLEEAAKLGAEFPEIVWTVAVVVLCRILLALGLAGLFQRVREPGVPRRPKISRWRSWFLVQTSNYLTPVRGLVVKGLSRGAVYLTRFVLLGLLISLIPHPLVKGWFPVWSQPAMGAVIVVVHVVDRTYLHLLLGCWTVGVTTGVFVSPRWIVVWRFFFGCVPLVRVYRRQPHLGLATVLEPHELASAEAPATPSVWRDSWHVVVLVGNRPIRIATVFGKLHAERIANAFTALRQIEDQDRGVDKRTVAHSAFAFGRQQPRAE